MALLPRLYPYSPMSNEFDPFFNLFNDTFTELQKLSNSTSRTFSPRFDLKETKDNYLLDGEIPGIEQQDITIEFINDQVLSIKGRTETYKEESQRPKEITQDAKGATTKGTEPSAELESNYWLSERRVGEFARSFTFPAPVDHQRIKATLKNGVLNVVVPKMEKAVRSRKIDIE